MDDTVMVQTTTGSNVAAHITKIWKQIRQEMVDVVAQAYRGAWLANDW